jgi:hypothetical protein
LNAKRKSFVEISAFKSIARIAIRESARRVNEIKYGENYQPGEENEEKEDGNGEDILPDNVAPVSWDTDARKKTRYNV